MNGICDTWCEGCEFLAKSSDVYCDFLSVMARRRPCPAGHGCTERRRPAKYRHDPRLKWAEQAQREAAKREEKKTTQRMSLMERGRPRELRGASLDPEYIRNVQRARIARLLPILVTEQREAILAWRKENDLSQTQAGKLIGVSGSAISNWERGMEKARWDLLEKHGCRRPC